ncbi:MAG TPA: nickel-dependent lactate racemase [Burkholderiales bacterium]|nr:nickel-dependent lactate racemase [Burkholderiales bacterium]
MRLELNYGRGRYPLDLPDHWNVTVVRKPAMPVEENPGNALRKALFTPVSAPPLVEAARGLRTACILICDITRPVPNGLLLPEIVRQLLDAGMQPGNITVLVATGLHRPNEGAELEELVGDPWVTKTVRVENHFARDDAAHADLGRTSTRGTPVKIDRRFVEADLKIATGLVEPHFMAGFSGGRKVIAPGVAHKDTITTFHSARFMAHPKADNCILEGNPLHEEQLEIVRMIGPVLAVNTVIDEHRRLSFVNYGEVIESHLQAVAFAGKYTRVAVPRRFRTVVTSAAGYPLDKTYYQTVKGMVGPVDILEPGGNLVVVSECSEGLGSHEYAEAQRRLIGLGADGFLDDIHRKQFADIDEWQTQMQLKPMKAGRVHLYSSGLPAQDRGLTGVNLIDSVRAAVEQSVKETGDDAVAVIPEGPYVVPVYQPA